MTSIAIVGVTFAILGMSWHLRDVVVALNRIADALEQRK
jgi:hypothetical protein